MKLDNKFVERIVADVMGQLMAGTSPALPETNRAIANAATVATTTVDLSDKSNGHSLFVADPVITEDVLQCQLNGATAINIGAKSIVTPSGRDFLRTHKISWTRQATAISTSGTSRWLAVIVQSADSISAALDDASHSQSGTWKSDLAGSAEEAADLAVSALCRAESDGGVVFAAHAHLAACRANRNKQVRAAVVNDVASITAVAQAMGVNLLAISPAGKSYFEIRNMLRAFTAAGIPRVPDGWRE